MSITHQISANSLRGRAIGAIFFAFFGGVCDFIAVGADVATCGNAVSRWIAAGGGGFSRGNSGVPVPPRITATRSRRSDRAPH